MDYPEFMSIFIATVTVVFSVVYVYAATYVLRRNRSRRAERKNKFFETLLEGLKSESITTMDDLVDIYKGVAGLGSEDLTYRYGLSNQLREFLVSLISKDKNLIDSSIDNEAIRDWKERISEFIRRNEEISPYADLPASERNILSDISTFLERNDVASVKRKTLELAGMIQARNDESNRIRSMNRWLVPLSIIGVVLTIAFGLTAIFT